MAARAITGRTGPSLLGPASRVWNYLNALLPRPAFRLHLAVCGTDVLLCQQRKLGCRPRASGWFRAASAPGVHLPKTHRARVQNRGLRLHGERERDGAQTQGQGGEEACRAQEEDQDRAGRCGVARRAGASTAQSVTADQQGALRPTLCVCVCALCRRPPPSTGVASTLPCRVADRSVHSLTRLPLPVHRRKAAK